MLSHQSEKIITNKQERLNAETFASDKAQQIYLTYTLKGIEIGLIRKYFVKQNADILDIGCGYGRTTKPLSEMGFHVVGIDVVPRMIETAHRENPSLDFRLMGATDLEFPDATFDYVLFSFNGIDYIYPRQRRMKALSEIHRVLKPNGICILSSHNSAALFTKPSFFVAKTILRNIITLRIMTPYIIAKHEEGDLLTYFRMPLWQKMEYEKKAFQVLEVRGKKHSYPLAVNLFEGWPHYVLKKE